MQIDLRGVGVGHGAAASAAIADSAGASKVGRHRVPLEYGISNRVLKAKVGGSLGRHEYAGQTRMAALRFTFMGVKFDSSFPPFTTLFSG